MSKVKELRASRAKIVADARKLVDKANAENRQLSAEEQAQWEQMMADVDALKARVDQLETVTGLEEEVSEPTDSEPVADDDAERSLARLADGERRTKPNRPGESRVAVERRDGESNTAYSNRVRRSQPEYRAAFRAYLLGGWQAIGAHQRALQADSDILGGYLVPPQQFLDQLIKFVDDAVFIRAKATKETLTEAHSLGVPTLDTDVSDADWTVELATGNEDSSLALGKREFNPHPLAKRIKVSNKLLRLTSNGAETLVRDRLAYKFSVSQEKAFLTGDGQQKPLGLFVASTNGIPTSRDVDFDTTPAVSVDSADDLLDAFYSLKSQYQAVAEWVMHRDYIKFIRKIKDANNVYVWQPGLQDGEPDRVLGRPVNVSEFAPNTPLVNDSYAFVVGDLSFYWIVDALTITIQRLVELYAETNQTGFIGREEVDGMPVLAEAFARGKVVGN